MTIDGTSERLQKPTCMLKLIERVDLISPNQSKPITHEQFLHCLADVKHVHDLEAQCEGEQLQ